MPISQDTFFNMSQEFIELANELQVGVMEELRRIVGKFIDDPNQELEQEIDRFTDEKVNEWYEQAVDWIVFSLASAYLFGIRMQDRELESMLDDVKNEGNAIPAPRFAQRSRVMGSPSEQAKKILELYRTHWKTYGRYENTFRQDLRGIMLPFRNSTVQTYRDIAALRLKPEFALGTVATRNDLAQMILNEFADFGVSVVPFPSQYRMSIEAFANRESRAYLQHVAVQGQISRAIERGYDLVRINSYAGPSPMCAPHQGNVYSLSGDSGQYPPLQDAIFDGTYEYGSGIYHDFCGHFQTTYIPGVSEPITITDSATEQRILEEMGEADGNKYIFEKRQIQRQYEYNIRKYKRRKAVGLDENERDRSERFIRAWQKRQREHVDEYPFLKRNYTREAV